MKLINYQKQVVRERGTEGQRVILVDKRRRLDRSNDLTAENILTSSWPLTSRQSPDLCSGEHDGGHLIPDWISWPKCLFISTVIYTYPEKLSRIVVWNWSHPLPSPSVMPGLLSTVHPFVIWILYHTSLHANGAVYLSVTPMLSQCLLGVASPFGKGFCCGAWPCGVEQRCLIIARGYCSAEF